MAKKKEILGNPPPCHECGIKGCKKGMNCRKWQAWFKSEWREATLPLRSLLAKKNARGRRK